MVKLNYMELPKINIKYSRFLDPVFIFYCKNNPDLKTRGWNDWTPPTKEKVLERIKAFKKEWGKYKKVILEGICGVLDLNFKQNIIDVYVVSGNPRQFSDPIVLTSTHPPEEFVDSLTHELIHKLFQNNINIFPVKILSELFPNESKKTRNHIFTHAVLKYIYLDVLKNETRLKNDLKRSSKSEHKDYTRAWEIVEGEGYLKLINDLKRKIKSGVPFWTKLRRLWTQFFWN